MNIFFSSMKMYSYVFIDLKNFDVINLSVDMFLADIIEIQK